MDIPFDLISVSRLVQFRLPTVRLPDFESDDYQDIIDELRDFGITDLRQLSELLNAEFVDAVDARDQTFFGVLRDAMMFRDIDGYFARAWKDRWGASVGDHTFLLTRWGPSKLHEVETSYDVYFLFDN